MPVTLYETPAEERTATKRIAAVGETISLSSEYTLQLPNANGITQRVVHRIHAKIISAKSGKVELEMVSERSTYFERNGARLVVSERVV